MSIEEEWVKGVVLVAMLSRDNMASRDCGDADGSSSSSGGGGGGSSGGGIELCACAVECRNFLIYYHCSVLNMVAGGKGFTGENHEKLTWELCHKKL